MADIHAHRHPHTHPHPDPHHEHHFSSSDLVRDIVIGMADGLTVPFALAAGLSAIAQTHIVVIAGGAEIAAGSIAMGLGGFLAGRGDSEHYVSERAREQREIIEKTAAEEAEIYEIFREYGVSELETKPVLEALKRDPEAWVDFMMKFELGLVEPDKNRAMTSGGTIALSYIFGGLIPLFPYILMTDAHRALLFSAAITVLALAVFGFVKGRVTGITPIRSAMQTVLIGGTAAAAAFGLARLFQAG